MISRRDENRVMMHLLKNMNLDVLERPVYEISSPDDSECDSVVGAVGFDESLQSLGIDRVHEVVQKLVDDGYISAPQEVSGIPEFYEVHILPKGRYYVEMRRRALVDKLVWSIFVPIGLAIATAWLTVLVVR